MGPGDLDEETHGGSLGIYELPSILGLVGLVWTPGSR